MASIKYKTEDGFVSIPMSIEAKTNEENGNGIGTCSTSSGTSLEVTLTGYELVQNGFVAVTFENDVPANATLNVNGKGAKPIYYKGSAITADTIKADDTVMFAYDGTNYVVTSLGGGGGSSTYPELVTIQLTQSGGSDSDLIGATVVVTNDDTSATILSTTWYGSDIVVQIEGGVDYTVTVGDITDYAVMPKTYSYTAIQMHTRIINFEYTGGTIDLGLPSGLLWATRNIDVTQTSKFASSAFSYDASYHSWGNTENVNPTSATTFNHTWNYSGTPGQALTGDVPLSQDAAYVVNNNWRLPTATEFTELINNCDFIDANGNVISGTNKLTTINGVVGIYLQSKNNNKKIFFACCGAGRLQELWNRGVYGCYWSSTYTSAQDACLLHFNDSSVDPNYNNWSRYYGMATRPVRR